MSIDMINFQVDKSANNGELFYRPFGIRTLKLSVSTAKKMPPLRVRPKAIHKEESEADFILGYADDGRDFIVSWGGGHETGPCVKSKDSLMATEEPATLEPNTSSIVFFNLRHVGPGIPNSAKLTLEAFEDEGGSIRADLSLKLKKPKMFTTNPIHYEEVEPGNWVPQGNRMTSYDPRWWPRPINYGFHQRFPLIHIKRMGKALSIQRSGKEIAKIIDVTNPSILGKDALAFELFNFDYWHYALRIWFFWLDNKIGRLHEVPDAERFDLLIRKVDGVVTLACTDLHWREVWGQIKDPPMQATIGLTLEKIGNIFTEKIKDSFSKRIRENKVEDKAYNPIKYIEKRAAVLGKQGGPIGRASGPRSHIPDIKNVVKSSDEFDLSLMVSSDVRFG
jgi:hypothetical protein